MDASSPSSSRAARMVGWLVRSLFSLGVAILFLLLLWSVSAQISPPPEPQDVPYPRIDTEERCRVEDGTWQNAPSVRPREPVPVVEENRPGGFCQGPLRFERERQAQQRQADRTAFFVFILGGSAALIAGLPLLRLTPVAPGFLGAGVLSLLVSMVRLWEFAGGMVRLVTIAALLILVVLAGAYFLRDKGSSGA